MSDDENWIRAELAPEVTARALYGGRTVRVLAVGRLGPGRTSILAHGGQDEQACRIATQDRARDRRVTMSRTLKWSGADLLRFDSRAPSR